MLHWSMWAWAQPCPSWALGWARSNPGQPWALSPPYLFRPWPGRPCPATLVSPLAIEILPRRTCFAPGLGDPAPAHLFRAWPGSPCPAALVSPLAWETLAWHTCFAPGQVKDTKKHEIAPMLASHTKSKFEAGPKSPRFTFVERSILNSFRQNRKKSTNSQK